MHKRRDPQLRRLLVPAAAVAALSALALAAVLLLLRPGAGGVRVDGPADGALLSREAAAGLSLRVAPGPGTDPSAVQATLSGAAVRVTPDGGQAAVTPAAAPGDGRHELVVTVPGAGRFGRDAVVRRAFTVDTAAPTLTLEGLTGSGATERLRATSLREPLVVKGQVDGAERVEADGKAVPVDGGRIELRYERPPAEVAVVATDAAGNVTRKQLAVGVRHPGMRAVHMTALAWGAKSLREPVVAALQAKTIDTVQLDIKDEDGAVGYDSQVPLARESGAAKGYYDARKAIDEIHALGGRVVGRIVAFRDPTLGKHSWTTGARDRLVQTPDGQPYSGKYGAYSFVNPASPEVRRYNVDLAVEAARLGFDDVLYDYIRRPDGSLDKLRFPGMRGAPEATIVDFLRESREAVRPAGAYVGVSVYGIAATRPTQIAQDIPGMAKHADYISPMVYPSHWGPGEYGVKDPNAQPYDIVGRSLADFKRIVEGSDTTIMPWLQDFSLGRTYGAGEVAAQIKAAKDGGMESFILWNAASKYTWAGLR